MKRTLGQALPASELLREVLKLFQMLGRKLGIANAIEELGAVSVDQGDCLQAARLFSTAHAMHERMGAPLSLVDRATHDSVLAACRAQLGEAVFASAWDDGKAFSSKQAIDFALDK